MPSSSDDNKVGELTLLPSSFTPGELDVIVGRGKVRRLALIFKWSFCLVGEDAEPFGTKASKKHF